MSITFLSTEAVNSFGVSFVALFVAIILLAISVALLITGRKHKGANIAVIILFSLIAVYTLVTIVVTGGNLSIDIVIIVVVSISIIGTAAVSLIKLKKKHVENKGLTAEKEGLSTTKTDGNRQETVAPLKGRLLDKDKALSVTLENENGGKIDFERVDALYSNASGVEKLYAVLKMVGDADDTVYIAEYIEADDSLVTPAEVIATKVFDEWQGSLNRTGAIYGVQVYDVIVHKADWKQFRKRATQDELMALAIGSKINLSGAMVFIKAAVSAVGTILSIVLGITLFDDFGMFSLIILVGGYLFFNLMASKLLGYLDTYNSCYSKLNSQNRDYIKSLFKEHAAVSILRMLVLWGLMLFTLPYKFLLMIIETLVPAARNWTIAHGGEAGAVITLPKGYDIGDLGALGQYYASFRFSDAWQQQMEEYGAARLAKFSEYTYRDKNGVLQKAYSDDGMRFYTSTDKLAEVGTSTDGGKTIDLK